MRPNDFFSCGSDTFLLEIFWGYCVSTIILTSNCSFTIEF
uniref:Uncharacterized protein n=1 Tax=Arundo donax TaxID=35708 RepID=A0A0A8Z7X6_ARUDO